MRSDDSAHDDHEEQRADRDPVLAAQDVLWEYVERLNRGEAIDEPELRSKHAGVADEVLRQLEAFREIGDEEASSESHHLGTLGDYTLRRQIGRGGMGTVYDAWQNSMHRRVALKVLPRALAADARAATRFLREAQIAGKLDHPNVVHVHGTGVEEQVPYYAMEFVEGETLAQILSKLKETDPETETPFGPMDHGDYFIKVARAFADVADGLQHAHSKGVTHRDIKPSNLVLDGEGRLRILDFGLARLEGQESLTLSGDVVGTPLYMSPEQARQKKIPVDHRTDIYSLGATMYEAICGRPPFQGKDHADTLSQIIGRDPVEPRKVNQRIPKDLETIVLKCLRKDAGDRYGTAETLGQDLRRFMRGDAVEARPENRWDRFVRRLARHRVLLTSAAGILLLGSIGLAISTALIARERDLAETGWETARRNLYVSNVQLAHQDWQRGNLGRFRRLLDAHSPEPGREDLRGWEWYYLDGLRSRAGRTLGRHASKVTGVDWSRDGRFLASVGSDAIRLWDGQTGQPLDKLAGSFLKAEWLPRGDLLACLNVEEGSWRLRVFRVQDGKINEEVLVADAREEHRASALPRSDWEGAQPWLQSLAWSAVGEYIACAGGRHITIYDAADARLVRALDVPDEPLSDRFLFPGLRKQNIYRLDSVEWSRDETWLIVAASEPGRIFVWDTTSWSHRVIDAHEWKAHDATLDPGQMILATGGYSEMVDRGEIRLWDIASGQPWSERHLISERAGVFALDWSPDGTYLASAGADGVIAIHDVRGKTAERLQGHIGRVFDVSWCPVLGRLALASGGYDGRVILWDLGEPHVFAPLDAKRCAAWSPDGRVLVAGSPSDDGVLLVEGETGEVLCGIDIPRFNLRAAEFSPDGGLLAVAGDIDNEGAGIIVAVGTREVVWRFVPNERRVRTVSWHPDSELLATAGNAGGIRIWNVAQRAEARRPLSMRRAKGGSEKIVDAISWSPDGRRLASGTRAQSLHVWDASRGELKYSRALHPEGAYGWRNALDWSPDGTRIAAGSSEGVIVVLDAKSGTELVRRHAHALEVVSLAWHPGGHRLASSSSDRTVKLWDTEKSEALVELLRFELDELPNHVSWSPNGTRLAAAEWRSKLRVWSAAMETTD